MTIHKLSGGSGYTYLTRQVAAGDQTLKQGDELASYYVVDGQPPGQWFGQGATDLKVSGEVTESQMRALFGEGRHPDADRIEREMIANGFTPEEAVAATQLGRAPYKYSAPEDDGFTAAVESQYAAFRDKYDRDPRAGKERNDLRRLAARTLLSESASDQEVARFLAERGRGPKQNVAGFDCVFTPAKSVSVLWAVGDDSVHEQVRQAHEAAWQKSMLWVQEEASLTRVGVDGIAQLDANGLVAATFEHHDSRAGDPNLHTHVAIANRVKSADGRWRTLDARVLHSLAVAASERYNTLIETELNERLGVQFHDVTHGRAKRPVREIDGIDPEVIKAFSTRRTDIETAYAGLLGGYRASHGHEPSKAEQWKLMQQATLDTRDAKAPPKRLSQQRSQWQEEAQKVLGSNQQVKNMIGQALHAQQPDNQRLVTVGDEEIDITGMSPQQLGELAIQIVGEDRSTWTKWNIEAQAQRLARLATSGTKDDPFKLAAAITDSAEGKSAIRISAPELNPVPFVMRRRDGGSIYRVHGGERYTSDEILTAEDNLVQAAKTHGGLKVSNEDFEKALTKVTKESGRKLNEGQIELARRFASGGHLIEAGIGPAGSGKTSSMQCAVAAINASGGRVLALGPSAAAAAVLGDELGVQADTIHKLLHAHKMAEQNGQPVPDEYRIDHGTVLLVDEAGMAGTPRLSRLLNLARANGASVRLLGDPAQLSAVESGGALRLIASRVGAAELSEVHRFQTLEKRKGLFKWFGKPISKLDPEQAKASLDLREGNENALAYYVKNDRVHAGSHDSLLEDIYAAWHDDQKAGQQSLMIAASNTDVTALNARAHAERVKKGQVKAQGTGLHDGNTAAEGDLIVTRLNDRRISGDRRADWVRNGDVWEVENIERDGSIRARNISGGHRVTLPQNYVKENVELAYASTIHRVQGMTVDKAHLLVEPGSTREQLYVGATRARFENHLYVVTEHVLDLDADRSPDPTRAARDALETVLHHDGQERSATETIDETLEHAASLATLIPEYDDAATRVLDPDAPKRMESYIHDLAATDPALAEQILSDPAWASLATRMADHEANGADLPELISEALSARELDTAKSVAEILHYRLGETQQTRDPRLPTWTNPARRTDDENVDVRQWLDRQADLIDGRITSLVNDAAASKANWVTAKNKCPNDPEAAEQWRQAARTIVAYRDQYEVRGQDPLGPEKPGIQGQRRAQAEQALTRLQQTRTRPRINAGAQLRATTSQRLAQLKQRRQQTQEPQRTQQPRRITTYTRKQNGPTTKR